MHDHAHDPKHGTKIDLAAAVRAVPEPRPRPTRVDPATVDAIRLLNAQIGEAQARAQALVSERSLILTKALARAGCAPEDLDLASMAPDGTLTYREAPAPLPPEVVAALEQERAERRA